MAEENKGLILAQDSYIRTIEETKVNNQNLVSENSELKRIISQSNILGQDLIDCQDRLRSFENENEQLKIELRNQNHQYEVIITQLRD